MEIKQNGFVSASIAVTAVLAILLGVSLWRTVLPASKQGKEITGLVTIVAMLVGIAGWVLAYMGLRGNVNAMLSFLFFAVLTLFALNTTFGVAGSIALRKIREALVDTTVSDGKLLGPIITSSILCLAAVALFVYMQFTKSVQDPAFLMPILITFVLMIVGPVSILSGVAGYFQLNGLRDTVAAKKAGEQT